jgi:hypothetical protein
LIDELRIYNEVLPLHKIEEIIKTKAIQDDLIHVHSQSSQLVYEEYESIELGAENDRRSWILTLKIKNPGPLIMQDIPLGVSLSNDSSETVLVSIFKDNVRIDYNSSDNMTGVTLHSIGINESVTYEMYYELIMPEQKNDQKPIGDDIDSSFATEESNSITGMIVSLSQSSDSKWIAAICMVILLAGILEYYFVRKKKKDEATGLVIPPPPNY